MVGATEKLNQTVKQQPNKTTISPSRHHSLMELARQEKQAQFDQKCAAFKRFTVRSPFVRYSPQKLREVARLLKELPLTQAHLQMQYQLRKAARLVISPLLLNAMNMVKQLHGDPKEFVIAQALVGRGRYRKRLDIKGRGRVGIIRRPSCFLRIVCERQTDDRRESKLKRVLLRSLNRSMRKQPRDDKPVYLQLRY